MPEITVDSTIAKQERGYTEKEHHALVEKLLASKLEYRYWTALIMGKELIIGSEAKDLSALSTKVAEATTQITKVVK